MASYKDHLEKEIREAAPVVHVDNFASILATMMNLCSVLVAELVYLESRISELESKEN